MARRGWNGPLAVTLAAVIVWVFASPVAAAPGDLDRSFGQRGTVITNLTPWNENTGDVAIQADGRIVVVGRASSRSGYGSFAVLRYRAGGRLDRGFGRDGVVVTDVSKREDSASAVAIQPNGRIVVVGSATVAGRDTIAVVRYRRAGALDRTFGEQGIATVDTGGPTNDETGEDVAIQPNGNIVVAGTLFGSSSFGLARLDRHGELDDSFDGDGVATADVGGELAVTSSLAIQPDGEIVIAGASWTEAGFDGIAVVRFAADGQVVNSTTYVGETTPTQDALRITEINYSPKLEAATVRTVWRIRRIGSDPATIPSNPACCTRPESSPDSCRSSTVSAARFTRLRNTSRSSGFSMKS